MTEGSPSGRTRLAKPSFPEQLRGAVLGLLSAATFGVGAPLAKLLLGTTEPILLAGLLYLGAAIGLFVHRALRGPSGEARLRLEDRPKLFAIVLFGGVIGPMLMLFGLDRVSALSGSLLLNLEAPFTILVAVWFFGEHLGRRAGIASALILGGAVVLNLEPGAFAADGPGVLLLGGACLAWAIDNNLTQQLSVRDPFAIVRVKSVVAGSMNVALGLFLGGARMPDALHVLFALALGSVSYGVSIVLHTYALRFVGAAREAAYFATAPFVGALVSIVLLGDPLRWYEALAMLTMAIGVGFSLHEKHSHRHVHEPLEHEHLHRHDVHHQHEHSPDDPPGEPHSHRHRHEPLVHEHPHVSDSHHRHTH